MGCDIHVRAEKRDQTGNWICIDNTDAPFDRRSYSKFAFIAGVRNMSKIKPISIPRGLPDDVTPIVHDEFKSWGIDAHSESWLTIDELLNFDYNQIIEDFRHARPNLDGKIVGNFVSLSEYLGQYFFEELKQLQNIGADRIVFWFDC